jgi:epoxyqueuosine reductase QueG
MKVDDLRNLIEEHVTNYPSDINTTNWWRKPLLVTAKIDDRFKALPEIAAEGHMLPWELMPKAKSLIVFFVSFIKELVDENTPGKFPCRNWGLAYESTNSLIGFLSDRIKNYLAVQGYMSELTPATHNFDEVRLVSMWSHKHLAHLLVTEAELGDNPLVGPEELCLYKRGEECLQCVKRCPVSAVSEESTGIDRKRCWDRLKFNLKNTEALGDLQESTHVCAKCAVGLPCSFNPDYLA